jgi:serine/threonine protein kinase
LRFRRPNGSTAEATVTARHDDSLPAVPPLWSCLLTLEHGDGTEKVVRYLAPASSGAAGGAAAAGVDHGADEALDSEILAGLRLSTLCGAKPYPATVSRLIGYDAIAAEPYALLEPYRGRPVGSMGKVLPSARTKFIESLLTGLRWINAAGIAHRAISPYTVYWDDRSAQITEFASATLIGAPREAMGAPPWQAREQRPGTVYGSVTDRDDTWAAGRLIFFAITGQEITGPGQFAAAPDLERLLDGVFKAPEERPAAMELLGRLNVGDPVPRPPAPPAAFQRGTSEFYAVRADKHPRTAPREEWGPEPDQSPLQPRAQQAPRTMRAEQDKPASRRRWGRGR